jgi:hypothetical protein
VRRYFQGRLIDTPPPSLTPDLVSPSPIGSLTPTPIPTTTPYVRRYFQGRLIGTPPPSPVGSLTPTPIPTTTPYVRRYFQGHLIATPPPSLTPDLASPSASGNETPTPIPTTTPYVRRYFNGRPIDTPSPTGSATPPTLPSPRATASATPHSATPSLRSDALLGTWDCTTFGGTTLTHEFSRADDAVSLYVTTTIALPNGKNAKLHEVYDHNPNTHVWTAVLAGGLIYAKGSDWTGDTWTLVGQSRENGTPTRFRMVFIDLGSDAYRRDFQRPDSASWATYAGETCRRAALVAP